MKYTQIEKLTDQDFRRLTKIKRITFNMMVDILKKENEKKKTKGGRKNKLSIENQLVMTLKYLRPLAL